MNFNNLYDTLLSEAVSGRESTKNYLSLEFVRSGIDKNGKPKGQWLDEDGNKPPAHVRKVFIPFEAKGVKYNPDPKGKGVVAYKDSKGRGVVKYRKSHTVRAAVKKFKRVARLDTKLNDLKIQKVYDQMRKSDLAKCLAVIMNTALRVGGDGDTGAEEKAYGASNLQARHIIVKGSNVWLDFIGKKAVSQYVQVHEPVVAAMLIEQKKKAMLTKDDTTRIFDDNTTEYYVLKYMRKIFGPKFKVHDVRTCIGTRIAIDEVKRREAPTTKKEYKIIVKEVAAVVADKLGNEPGTALKSYINPLVFKDWRDATGMLNEFVIDDKYINEDEYAVMPIEDFVEDEDIDADVQENEIPADVEAEYPELDDAEIGETTKTLVDILGFKPE